VKQGEYFAENPEIVKIFDDLEQFKLFCQTAFGWGHDGYVFNEKDLYNNRSRAWQAFQNFKKGKKRPYRRNNGGRYYSNRRN
jgi:hypothetical protein